MTGLPGRWVHSLSFSVFDFALTDERKTQFQKLPPPQCTIDPTNRPHPTDALPPIPFGSSEPSFLVLALIQTTSQPGSGSQAPSDGRKSDLPQCIPGTMRRIFTYIMNGRLYYSWYMLRYNQVTWMVMSTILPTPRSATIL